MKPLNQVHFAFLSHEAEGTTGFPLSFAEYLKKRDVRFTFVSFPFFYSHTKSIWIEQFKGSQLLSRKRSWIRFFKPQLLSFVKDFLWLMSVGWIHIWGADFVLVSNNLTGFAALIFRRLGIIRRFSYLVVDYSPQRFSIAWVERIYVWLDRLVATNADSVWTMSLAMLEGREKDGRFQLKDVRYRLAPMGNNAEIIFANGPVANNPRDLIFVGNPNAKNVRADFLIQVAQVMMKRGESFRLIFVGPGETSHLVKMAVDLGVAEHVVFRGGIPDLLDLERFMATCGIGLAPYDPNLKDNFSRFADPAKIKGYLGCGLPVITSTVPVIGKELEERGAGIVAEFQPERVADEIVKLWSSESAYREARAAALAMGMEFTWSRIFDRLMREEGIAVPPQS